MRSFAHRLHRRRRNGVTVINNRRRERRDAHEEMSRRISANVSRAPSPQILLSIYFNGSLKKIPVEETRDSLPTILAGILEGILAGILA